ncbi:TlpA family protein disulfide reductase [Actinoalloteichus hymeniacidonis]|uniref:Thiol-disulfide isomerase-like thioredoxin n=1 Tax=Actinoalloteichus hymeniacidonis TaxID=340345 RepID=A0AAC9HLQ5_9PSEU|nr:TlpA disulfide reductase family protein [Actinoalloteichus hymeniacidonis]AOS61101.1 thiol-disulfide isomerase-like thioredoxin [Actinoalloteichus hymeniacidonis]MBB5910898.1 thiol-disulfide isomerase/thioredoxin [Actinoalloteichus hymeniacidonis]
MNANVRWSVLVLVLAVAGMVALWPRGNDSPPNIAEQPPTDSADQEPGVRRAADLAGIEVSSQDGSSEDLGELLADGPVLVNIWATWCVPCREELPVLAEYAADPDAIPVLALQTRSDYDAGLELLAELDVDLQSVHDGDDVVIRALRAPGIPMNYVVDQEGTIHRVDPPVPFEDSEQVRQAVARYLEQS